MKEENKRNDLIVRYFNNECSQEEVNELLSWVEESVDNERNFNDFKYTWMASLQLKPVDSGRAQIATEEFINRLVNSSKDAKAYNSPRSRNMQRVWSGIFLKYAAIVITAFFLGILAKNIFVNKIQSVKTADNKYFSFESPKGSRSIATLPDGTKVWLNASSKISYSLDFNMTERIIMLEGEAYFDVETNPSKPFIVKAHNLDIKAYGTLFNVKAYPEEDQVITTLVEGKVTIEGIDEANKRFSIKMAPKQCVTYSTENKSVAQEEAKKEQSVNSDSSNVSEVSPAVLPDLSIVRKTLPVPEINTSWKDERWIIANENLQNLSVMLERRFNVNIKFSNEELKEYHFSGIIQNENIEQVMNILSLTMPVRYSIDINNIELELNKELKNRYINALKTNNKDLSKSN
jgi:transmembrane sensor